MGSADDGTTEFQFAYIVRAVSPGTFRIRRH